MLALWIWSAVAALVGGSLTCRSRAPKLVPVRARAGR